MTIRDRCSAVKRRFSPDRKLRWMPTVDGEIVTSGNLPFSGFATRAEAVAAARRRLGEMRVADYRAIAIKGLALLLVQDRH